MKLQLAILLLCSRAMAATIHVAWNAVPGATGYSVYYWTAKDSTFLNVGNVLGTNVSFTPGVQYSIGITAHNDFEYESDLSGPYIFTLPVAPAIVLPNLTLTESDRILLQSSNLVNWSPAVVLPTVATVPMGSGPMFYRWQQARSRIEIKRSL